MPYTFKLGILLASLSAVAFGLSATPYAHWLHHYYWYMMGFFLLLTVITHLMMQKGIRSDGFTGLNYFMGSNTVRLFLAGAVLIGYLYASKDKSDRLIFTANFFVLYISFTLFEIWSVMATLRPNSGKPGSNGVQS